MKNQKPDVLVLLNEDTTKKKLTKAELAIQKQKNDEKMLIWKAMCYSYHIYARRGDVQNAVEVAEMLKKYFPLFVDVDKNFTGMIKPKFLKQVN